MNGTIRFRDTKNLPLDAVLHLYRTNDWSSAEKPELLLRALESSHSVISAWDGELLVGLGNAISDGHLVVYYPHLLVLPEYQGRGIGRAILQRLQERYASFHQQVVLADGESVGFYCKCGFERAGLTQGMWIFKGKEHFS